MRPVLIPTVLIAALAASPASAQEAPPPPVGGPALAASGELQLNLPPQALPLDAARPSLGGPIALLSLSATVVPLFAWLTALTSVSGGHSCYAEDCAGSDPTPASAIPAFWVMLTSTLVATAGVVISGTWLRRTRRRRRARRVAFRDGAFRF